MVRELMSKFMGLFSRSGKVSASGLYNTPTFSQVERLIAAAKGEEYTPPERPPMYSQPTFSQFERLIEALKGSKSSAADAVSDVKSDVSDALLGIPVGNYSDTGDIAGRLDAVIRAIKGISGPDDRTMYFQSLEDGSTVAMVKVGDAPAVSLEYSVDDGSNWAPFIVGETSVTLDRGKWVRLRATSDGVNSQLATSSADYNRFALSGSISVGGNSMSLFYSDYSTIATATGFPDSSKESILRRLFDGQTPALKDASALLLPATTLLPSCYNGMFLGCSALTAAPLLQAKVLKGWCYTNMFNGCASLEAAPNLPAAVLVSGCYSGMFNGCTHIRSVAADFSSFSDVSGATTNWLKDVSAFGTFHCKSGIEISERGSDTVPSGWTVVADR